MNGPPQRGRHLQLIKGDRADDTTRGALGWDSSAAEVARAIRSGGCSDALFDRLLPPDLRLASHQHWTPLSVALRVAEWLELEGVTCLVDIGSGAGKLCVAAALASRCHFTGIEQRARLVESANTLAKRFRVDSRVEFVRGVLEHDTIPVADAYYLYNPFGENLFRFAGYHIDDAVELSVERYGRDVELMEEFLDRAPTGTYVIKYNGFGGRMPRSYRQIREDRMPAPLRMWRKEE